MGRGARARASLTRVPAFPFRRFRPGQREALTRAREAFAEGKRFVVVEAPTGAGKSAIGVTLAREAGSAYLLTVQKLLQDQYVRDFADLAPMKGRANYGCLIAPTHAAAAPCIAGHTEPACRDCPYFGAKDEAMEARGALLNYAYYLAETNYGYGFGPRELLVLDEAHAVEGTLMGFVAVRLSDGWLRRAGVAERVPSSLDEEAAFDVAEDLEPRLRARSRELADEVARERLGTQAAVERLQAKRWLDTQAERIDTMLRSRREDDATWVVERTHDTDGGALVFRPVEVASLAEPLLFAHGERVLLLSASILDADTYLASLGIDPQAAEVIRVPSDFAPERRPVVVRPRARLARRHLEADLPRLVAAVGELMEAHAEEKGVIHAHSYRIAEALQRGLPAPLRARLVTHRSAAERDEALEAHLRRPEPTVLLTPSMTEGLDLPGDLARWQALCKVPYPYLGDPQVAARKEMDPGWYAWRTCMTVVQAYGRCVRSADDFAVTYLLDAGFPAFLRREWERFPEWFREAVVEETAPFEA